MKLLYENLHRSFILHSSSVSLAHMQHAHTLYEHQHMCACACAQTWMCACQRSRSCVSLYHGLHYSFETESLTDLTASKPEIILYLPLPPPQHWVTGTCYAFRLNVDVRIHTQNLKLVQHACLSWSHLFSPVKHYIMLLKVHLSAQGGFWTHFLRCIIWGEVKHFCVNVHMEFINNTSLSLLLCCINKKAKSQEENSILHVEKFKMHGAHWFLYIHLALHILKIQIFYCVPTAQIRTQDRLKPYMGLQACFNKLTEVLLYGVRQILAHSGKFWFPPCLLTQLPLQCMNVERLCHPQELPGAHGSPARVSHFGHMTSRTCHWKLDFQNYNQEMCTPCFIFFILFRKVFLEFVSSIFHPFGLPSSGLLYEYNMVCIAIHLKLTY